MKLFFLKFINPFRLFALHRKLMFQAFAICGKGLRITHRAEIFFHGTSKNQVFIGNDVLIDGTLDIYEKGKLRIGKNSFIGRSRIYSAQNVEIGEFCLISDNVCIMDSDLHPRSAQLRAEVSRKWVHGQFPDVYNKVISAPVVINNHCWIGYGSSILKGVTIGEGAIVGAASVVTKDVPPWTIVAGNPARVIREIPQNER